MKEKREPQSFPEHAAVIVGDKFVQALKSSRQDYTATDALNNIAKAMNRLAEQFERYNAMR